MENRKHEDRKHEKPNNVYIKKCMSRNTVSTIYLK